MDTKFIDNWKPGLIEIEDGVSMPLFIADAMPNESSSFHSARPPDGQGHHTQGAWLDVGSVLLPGIEIGPVRQGANACH